MPNHYYGYEPEKRDISFGSPDELMDTTYRKPLGDMSTNPNSPLYQAMDNQRGPTYNQMLEYEDEGDAYANDLEKTSVEITPLAQAMNNQGDQTSDTFSMEDYLESEGLDNSGERGMPTEDQLRDFETQRASSSVTANTGDTGNTDGGRTEPTAGTVDVNTGNTGGGRTEPTAGTVGRNTGNTSGDGDEGSGDEGGGDQGGGDEGGELKDPNNAGDGDGGGRSGSNNGGGDDGGGDDGGGNDNQDDPLLNFSGSPLEQALSDYDVPRLQEFYGNVFDEYSETRESFLEQKAQVDRARLDLQRDDAGIGLERQQGQFGRQEDLLQDQLGLNVNLNRIREEQTQLQREALEGREEDVDQDFAMRQRMLGLQEEQQAQALDSTRSGARNQLMGLYGQSEVTGGFAGSGARDMVRQRAIDSFTDNASNRISSLADTRRIGLARQQATQQRDRQLRGLGSQLSGLDLADRQRQFQFDNQQGRINNQLEGIQSELGDQGFLQRAFDNRMSGFDLTGRQQQQTQTEAVFNLRDDYKKDVRARLIDIIRGGGDLNPFKLTEEEKEARDNNRPDTGDSMDFYNEPRYTTG